MKHKKLFLAALFILMSVAGKSQNISVKSFKVLPQDMDARVEHPVKDQNGEKCALIKVVTDQQGFVWEGGMLGITKTEKKTGEYWVYVPHGAKKITIKHDKLGVLRDYVYPEAIKKATVYEMVLTTAEVKTVVEKEETPTEWVIINSEPEGANVYLNNNHKGKTPFQVEMEKGSYSYRVEKPLYKNKAGSFELNPSEGKKKLDFTLVPDYGYIQIKTTPVSNANVYIDGKRKDEKTPYKTERLKSGIYTVKVEKDLYHSQQQDVSIGKGETSDLSLELKPAFGSIRVSSTPDDASVTLDGKPTGKKTPCTLEEVLSDDYTVKLEKEQYHEYKQTVTVNDGQTKNMDIELKPAFGGVSIKTTPESGAKVLLNGNETDKTTPCTLEKLSSGTHDITLQRNWYEPVTKRINLSDGESNSLSVKLTPTYGKVDITTSPEAKVYIDDQYKSQSSWHGRLIAGWHTIEARKEKHTTDKEKIEVQVGQEHPVSLHPEAKTGILKIKTTPFGATIEIDSEEKGTTPNTFEDMLIGNYTLRLQKEGYGTVSKSITIKEDKTLTLEEPLPEGKEITIRSEPAGAKLSIDGIEKGNTPYTTTLKFGEHSLKLVNDRSIVKKQISISQNEKKKFMYQMPAGKEITIRSQPSGATLFIDGKEKGNTPYTTTLQFGNHSLKLATKRETVKEQITVSQHGKKDYNYNVKTFDYYTLRKESVSIEMVNVEGGTFEMGCNSEQSDCNDEETPVHTVTVDDFAMSKYEITNQQYANFMNAIGANSDGSYNGTEYLDVDNYTCLINHDGNSFVVESGKENHPVMEVTWYGAQAFCEYYGGRLPTEAEWEFAARGGNSAIATKYAGSNDIDEVAWFTGNSGILNSGFLRHLHEVGTKAPNELGFYDMSGNLWEFCYDWYDKSYYSRSQKDNPKGPEEGSNRVCRGSCWGQDAWTCRVTTRGINTPGNSINNVGFRLLREL